MNVAYPKITSVNKYDALKCVAAMLWREKGALTENPMFEQTGLK